jgi:CheY-like chemotaxis protein
MTAPVSNELSGDAAWRGTCRVEVAPEGATALKRVGKFGPEVILLDVTDAAYGVASPSMDALTSKPDCTDIHVILMSAAPRSNAALNHPRIEALLARLFDVDVVVAAVEYALTAPRSARMPLGFLRSSTFLANPSPGTLSLWSSAYRGPRRCSGLFVANVSPFDSINPSDRVDVRVETISDDALGALDAGLAENVCELVGDGGLVSRS